MEISIAYLQCTKHGLFFSVKDDINLAFDIHFKSYNWDMAYLCALDGFIQTVLVA